MTITTRLFAAVVSALLAAFALQAAALSGTHSYGAFLEDSDWKASGSALECRLMQQIPEFGEGAFKKAAGEELAFYLKPYTNVFEPGPATLVAETPVWKHNLASQAVTTLEVTDHPIPVQVEKPYASLMLSHLKRGMMPSISAPGIDALSKEERVKVAISPVNFQSAYQEYLDCLAQLLPVSFRQIARSAIFFDTNDAALDNAIKEQLRLIARYVKADKRVKRIYVDGHTDNVGDKRLNKKISQRRTAAVVSYLKQEGVNGKILVSRFHGDRYPALSNDTEENRARNRRVTIRLER